MGEKRPLRVVCGSIATAMAPSTLFPIDYVAIRIALVRAIRAATGLDQNHVIMFEPEVANAPRPTLPYITTKIIVPGARYGDDVAAQTLDAQGNPSTVWNYGGPRQMTASFQSYGHSHEEAYNYLACWQAHLDMVPTQEILRASGIAVWLIGAVKDLSMLLNAGYEGRAQMDCRFGLASNTTADLGSMDTYNIQGTIDTGVTPENVEVTVED